MATRYKSNRAKVEARIEQLMQRELISAAVTYERSLQASFREPKSGRIYRVGKTPTRADRAVGRRFRSHRASAPGEAPAIDTAALSKGVTRVISRVGKAHFVARIGMSVQSGRSEIVLFLEFGTSRIAPRPAWRRALEVLRANMNNIRGGSSK